MSKVRSRNGNVQASAAIAVVAYALAEMPGVLPRPTAKPSHDKQEVTRPAAR